MNLSLLIPSRNNLEFLKLAYSSIRKNQRDHHVEILVLDDKSDKDNTWEWCEETMKSDFNFKAFKNNRKERLGISSGFKFLSQQATQEVIGHFHADMVMVEGTLDAIDKELYWRDEDDPEMKYSEIYPKFKKVVCLTRIEPPIYNKSGVYPEKIIWQDAPIEIEDWDEQKFLDFLPEAKVLWNEQQTNGHFVPFFMFRDEYLKLGGNDIENFPKQAREDSDFAFRLVLDEFKTIQIPSFVYHFASRGNRRSKDNSGTWQDSSEWQEINAKSERNFLRKWHTLKLHDDDLTPLKPKVSTQKINIINCTKQLLAILEPFANVIRTDLPHNQLLEYVRIEQPNTPYNLTERILEALEAKFSVEINIDGARFTTQDYEMLHFLGFMIDEVGEFELGSMKIKVNDLNSYERELITCKNAPINLEHE